MFAVAFDMGVQDLRTFYGEPYNNAYYEISNIMEQYGFYGAQGSLYLTQDSNMANLFRLMNHLKSVDWFAKSVRDIRAFKVEDWSDFTSSIKE